MFLVQGSRFPPILDTEPQGDESERDKARTPIKQWNRIGANTIFVKTYARTGFTRSRVSHLRPYCPERSRNFVYILTIAGEARRVESAEGVAVQQISEESWRKPTFVGD